MLLYNELYLSCVYKNCWRHCEHLICGLPICFGEICIPEMQRELRSMASSLLGLRLYSKARGRMSGKYFLLLQRQNKNFIVYNYLSWREKPFSGLGVLKNKVQSKILLLLFCNCPVWSLSFSLVLDSCFNPLSRDNNTIPPLQWCLIN